MEQASPTIHDLLEAEAEQARLHGLFRAAEVDDLPESTGDPATDWAVALAVVQASESTFARAEVRSDLNRWHSECLATLWDLAHDFRERALYAPYGMLLGTIAGRLYGEGKGRRGDSCLTVAEGIAKRTGELRVALYVTLARADRSYFQGEFAVAQERYQLVVKALRRLDEDRHTGVVLLHMGDCALRLEDDLQAETLWSEAMLVFDEHDEAAYQALVLERLATLELRRGHPTRHEHMTELAMERWEIADQPEQADRVAAQLALLRRSLL